jgi:quercetin dioxygenase-like cupin family protein
VSSHAAEHPIWTVKALANRIVRYADLIPCHNAFIDSRSPGSEAKENFTIIGPGVSENPNQHVHISEPHGFNIGGARQPPGCINSQHSHDTAELFVVHSGEWRFDLGEHGDDAHIHLAPGDVISIPTGVFRGFTATAPAADGTPGFLWAVLGGDDPGRVLWAPKVFDMARDYGLVLLENGLLIDTRAGEAVPEGTAPMPQTTEEQAAALARLRQEDAEGLRWQNQPLSGAAVHAIVGKGARFGWSHGFALARIDVAAGGNFICGGEPRGQQVRFVHQGRITIPHPDGDLTLTAGDTITLPDGCTRDFHSGTGAIVYAVWAD